VAAAASVGKDVVVDVLVGALVAVVAAIAVTAMVSTSREADCVLAGVSGSATAAVLGELVDRPPPAAAEARRRKARMSVALGAVEVEPSWLLRTSHPSFSSSALMTAIVGGAVFANGVRSATIPVRNRTVCAGVGGRPALRLSCTNWALSSKMCRSTAGFGAGGGSGTVTAAVLGEQVNAAAVSTALAAAAAALAAAQAAALAAVPAANRCLS